MEINVTASRTDQAPLVSQSMLFKGEAGNPLLAPRGVWIVGSKLIVADTGQNRVFIWNTLPDTAYAPADVVLGQEQSTHTGRNGGAGVSAHTLQYPSGIWSDGERLIVADAWNHRVLIWHRFPVQHGQAADVVLGQPDFTHNQPNVGGIGIIPSAQTLNWPYGVFSDGERLWICDTGNRRILYYSTIPDRNFTAADQVIGKDSFTERDYEPVNPIWPYAVRIAAGGQMLVADTQYYRTMLWHDWQTAFTQPADIVIGQPSFEANGMNQYGLFPDQSTLSWTYDAFFYRNGLFVADTGNSRLLWFNTIPDRHAPLADNLIGHADFRTGSENANTRYGTDKQLYWPFSVCVEGDRLAVADTGNHRIVLYRLTGL